MPPTPRTAPSAISSPPSGNSRRSSLRSGFDLRTEPSARLSIGLHQMSSRRAGVSRIFFTGRFVLSDTSNNHGEPNLRGLRQIKRNQGRPGLRERAFCLRPLRWGSQGDLLRSHQEEVSCLRYEANLRFRNSNHTSGTTARLPSTIAAVRPDAP